MECYRDVVVTTPGTMIVSSNYPSNYENFCDSQLTINFEQRIFLRFELFNIEHQVPCILDWLEVSDEGWSDDNLIATKMCGSSIPDPIVSFGNSLKLTFHSDDSVGLKGFKIKADLGTKKSRPFNNVLGGSIYKQYLST